MNEDPFRGEKLDLVSRDFWVKFLENHQQNWALIEEVEGGEATVYFLAETSEIFDELPFPSTTAASEGLLRNGFRRFQTFDEARKLFAAPSPPFHRLRFQFPVYSSGDHWSA